METKSTKDTKTEALKKSACAFLRCKQDFVHAEFSERESASPRIYWCGKTLSNFGPDGEIAEIEICQPGRECFSETIREYRPKLIPESERES
ncbi:MAG TPA: hypothetical protein VNK96_02040 [Fimbriimonadales bacterium]|nr:hypothetical protein [Fimbriimonadales bacterium]